MGGPEMAPHTPPPPVAPPPSRGALTIARPQRGAEPEGRVVGEANGIRLVLGTDDGGDGPEGLLVERRHAALDGGEQCRRIERALAVGDRATQEQLRPALDGFLDLAVQRLPEIGAREWPDLGRAVVRVAHAAGAQLADEALDG